MSLRIVLRTARGEYEEAIAEMYKPIATAATRAIRDAADIAKAGARADIARAGFSTRWQNALRVDAYPKRSAVSANAAAVIYHKIPYAGVFEEGATIRGKPRLWIPMRHAPKKIGRNRFNPTNFVRNVGQLQPIKRGGKVFLGAKVAMSKSRAQADRLSKVTLSSLRKGASGDVGKRSVIRVVPLFVGVPSVTLRKRFNIADVVSRASGKLAALYMKHLQEN